MIKPLATLMCTLTLGYCGNTYAAAQPILDGSYVFSYPATLPDDVNADESNAQLDTAPNSSLGLILKVAQFDAAGNNLKVYADSYCKNPPFGPFFNGCAPQNGNVFLKTKNFLALLNGIETDTSPYTVVPQTLFSELDSNNLTSYFSGVVTDFETTNYPIAQIGTSSCTFYNTLIQHFNAEGLSVGVTINPNPADFDAPSAQCLNSALSSDPNNYYIVMVYGGESEHSIANAMSLIGTSAPYRFAIAVDGDGGLNDECSQIRNITAFTGTANQNYKGIMLYQYRGALPPPALTDITEALALHCS